MSFIDPRNTPWNPFEKVELLCEILKEANVPPETFLPIVRSLGPPDWNNIVLPRGRTLAQCQNAYREMVHPAAPLSLSRSGSIRDPGRQPEMTTSIQRPVYMEGAGLATGPGARWQDIQPRPVGAPTVINQPIPAEPPKKKRGRPPRRETELRREQALARGEPLPQSKRHSIAGPIPQLSAQPAVAVASSSSAHPRFNPAGPSLTATQAAQAVMTPPVQARPRASSETSSAGKRKRMKSARPESESRTSEEEMRAAESRYRAREYPDILQRDPQAGPSTFRAPRGEGSGGAETGQEGGAYSEI